MPKARKMKGGCAGNIACAPCAMKGQGPKLEAVKRAAKTVAKGAKKAGELAIKHRKDIAGAVALGATIASTIDPENVAAKKTAAIAELFGAGNGTSNIVAKRVSGIRQAPSAIQNAFELENNRAVRYDDYDTMVSGTTGIASYSPPSVDERGESLIIGRMNQGILYPPAAFEGLDYYISDIPLIQL